MRMFRKNKKQASPIRMPKKNGNEETVVRRKNKLNIGSVFKKKKNKYPTRRKPLKNTKYLILPIFFLFFIGIVYLSLQYVLFLRENAYGNVDHEITDVLGLESIPTYPGAQFIFEKNLDDSIVKEFLSGGNSAYRVERATTVKDIEDYYFDVLPELGWEFVQSVPIGTADRKYGQYWIKEGKGLRIYSKYRDIWYESITVDDAKTALAQLVKEEIEREMLMVSSEKQDLLPDYPWRIQVPKEYIIKYSPTDMKDLRAVSFQKMGSNEMVEIFPVGYWKAKELDYMLLDYCEIKSKEEDKYAVMNSIPISFRETLGLKSTLQKNSENITSYTIPNTYNSVVYVISSTQDGNPLLEYIIENLKPMGAKD